MTLYVSYNRVAYGVADLAERAAAYAFGIAKNRPFIDGNKRAALVSLMTLLGLIDIDFLVDEAEAVVMIRGLADGEFDQDGIARWIRDRMPKTRGERRPSATHEPAALVSVDGALISVTTPLPN